MEQILTCPDLSPRADAALEWWFVQGWFEGRRLGRREFMAALFRQGRQSDGPSGHMLLISTLDRNDHRHRVLSRVSPDLVARFLAETPGEMAEAGIDRDVIDAFIGEIAQGGPPRPVRTEPQAAEIVSAPFGARWSDFHLRQVGGDFDISFMLPEEEHGCTLRMAPRAAWMAEGKLGGTDRDGTLAYESCPRLALSGEVGGEKVHGEAWIDHQWVDYGWLRSPDDGGGLIGWDWFGLNLDDGTDLIVMVHRDAESGEPLSSLVAVFAGSRPPFFLRDAAVRATRNWLSPATMIDYPVAWEIEIPDIAASLSFEPLADNQEIPVFGFIRAIWEGAGRVTGTLGGRPVAGRARLELHGYGYVHDFKVYQRRWTGQVDRIIREFLPETLDEKQLAAYAGPPRWRYDGEAHTRMLSAPVWDLLSRGGKHWRPIFGRLMLEALGVDPLPFATMLSVIPELVHTGSLIIDDIEDGSPTRRGDDTIHVRYGLPTAINAANMLYFLPLLSIANHPRLTTAQREAVYRIIIEMFVQAHLGQAQDLYWSRLPSARRVALWQDSDTAAVILQAHAFKTAAAVRATAEIACIVARADEATRNACTRFAESWGVAFQIADDVNNFCKAPQWGKLRGEDIATGQFSFAIHRAVNLLDGADRRRLVEILESPAIRSADPGLDEAIRLVEKSGALDDCRAHARMLMEEDWPAFSRALPSSLPKIMLRILLTKLIDIPFET